jgi:predicted 3-demethylubiquinone-9 3-methyltransferase (glyoxalase superfamily)
MAEGTVMTIEFELDGQQFLALNAGPHFKFNEAVSFVVTCNTQEEIDYYWNKLGEGGDPKAQVCGWLKDKYGLSWQVVPAGMAEMMEDKKNAGKAMAALLKMKKFDIKALEDAIK